MQNIKTNLGKYVLAAKAILYDKERAEKLLKMLDTEDGTVIAVHSVLAAIEQHQHIPQEIATLLSMSVLALMLGMFKDLKGSLPPPDAIKHVTQKVMEDTAKAYKIKDQAQQQAAPQPQARASSVPAQQAPQGIIQGAMQ